MYGDIWFSNQKKPHRSILFLKSSKQGNIKAQYNLGELYEEKLNNKEKAIYWYEKSFSLGDNDSEKKLIELRGK